MEQRWLKNRWGIAALVAWVAVMVVGVGQRADSEYFLGTRYLSDIWSGILLVLGIIAFVVFLLSLGGDRSKRPPRSLGGKRKKAWPLVLIAIALLIWQPDIELGPVEGRESEAEAYLGDTGVTEEDAAERETVAEVADFIVVAAALGLVTLVVILTRRRSTEPEVSEPEHAENVPDADDLVQAMDRAVDRLHVGDDPRSAVLAAYAELEQVLAEQDFDRQPAETAHEHLTRSVRSLPVDGAPFERLGRLYDVARFSTTEVSEDDRRRAADALARARNELSAHV